MSVLVNRCLLFSLPIIVILTFASSVIHAEPVVVEQTNYYKITGFSEHGLRDQMNTHGPKSDSKPYHAYTQSQMRYHFKSKNTIGGCVITSCLVNVHVTYTMPKWTNKSDAPLALQGKWENYYRCLNNHEIGHRDIAVRNARLIEQTLIGLQGASNQAVANKAEEIVQQYIGKAKQEDVEYDSVTGHGRTQGAHFP